MAPTVVFDLDAEMVEHTDQELLEFFIRIESPDLAGQFLGGNRTFGIE